MAKNLQSVLNSVVSDLLQEASPAAAAVNKALYNSDPMYNAITQGAQSAIEADRDARLPGQIVQAGIETWKDGLPETGTTTPFTNARLKTRAAYEDSLSPWERAQIYGGKAVDWAGDQAEAIKQSMMAHPYYWGGGALGAALAAGAGAMYLRKKKKEADLAAGK